MPRSSRKPKIYPLGWLLLALIAIFCLHRWWPVATLVPRPFHWAGLLFGFPGVVILLHSAARFIQAKTGLIPFSEATTLVTSDFYRFSRNPMYLGMVLSLLGLTLFLGTASPLIPFVVFIWIIDQRFIRNEELFLEEVFGDEYVAYKRRVRRWI